MELESIKELNRHAIEFYGIDLRLTMDDIYSRLIGDKQFVCWVKCELNSTDDLFDQYMMVVEDTVLDTIDFSKGTDGFITYFMLTDRQFYRTWTEELFRKIIQLWKSN